jgi:hypothetical protein
LSSPSSPSSSVSVLPFPSPSFSPSLVSSSRRSHSSFGTTHRADPGFQEGGFRQPRRSLSPPSGQEEVGQDEDLDGVTDSDLLSSSSEELIGEDDWLEEPDLPLHFNRLPPRASGPSLGGSVTLLTPAARSRSAGVAAVSPLSFRARSAWESTVGLAEERCRKWRSQYLAPKVRVPGPLRHTVLKHMLMQ